MGKVHSVIDDRLKTFVNRQQLFFVATAPLKSDRHINLSPKGLDSLRILGPKEIAYLDYIGSGIETIAHLRENGRIVIMLCAFEGAPKIVRLHGKGYVVEPQDEGFASLLTRFGELGQCPGVRSIVRVDLERISDSCGYGVPLYAYQGQRSQLTAWAEQQGEDALLSYQRDNNSSIDDWHRLRDPPFRGVYAEHAPAVLFRESEQPWKPP